MKYFDLYANKDLVYRYYTEEQCNKAIEKLKKTQDKTYTLKPAVLGDFVLGYIEAALWASHATDDTTGQEYESLEKFDVEDIDQSTIHRMQDDCIRFQAENHHLLIGLDEAQCGRDFFLTRCGHGVGFWDRGLGEVGERLTKACESWGSFYFWLENGKVFGEDG